MSVELISTDGAEIGTRHKANIKLTEAVTREIGGTGIELEVPYMNPGTGGLRRVTEIKLFSLILLLRSFCLVTPFRVDQAQPIDDLACLFMGPTGGHVAHQVLLKNIEFQMKRSS